MQKDSTSELPRAIYSVASVRQMDRAAIDDAGIGGYSLMTRAAQAALSHAVARFPIARRWEIICGSGNNAGDGYVLARLAAEQGIGVAVRSLVSPETLRGDAMKAYDDFSAADGHLTTWNGELDPNADLLVDCLLGSGLTRAVEGRFAEAVAAMNEHRAPVLALDIPTGLNGDTGAVMGVAVQAAMTVTFVGLKRGLFIGDGQSVTGALRFAGLGIPDACRDDIAADLQRVTSTRIQRVLPRRQRDAHKGDFGHVVLVGGGPGMPGAIRLAGEAALRSGAGRVTIATHSSHAASVVAGRPELMCHAVDDAADLDRLVSDTTIVAIGPGLGRSEWAARLFDSLIERPLSLVLDADALNLLADRQHRRDDWILTPHPGEAARLLGESPAGIQEDRLAALGRLQDRYGGNIVLKGAGTLISAGKGPTFVCTAGNPGMAAAGMGDVLTGIIAALWAQGLVPLEAAAVGVEIHARAGDAAALAGERGMLASDLMKELRTWVNP